MAYRVSGPILPELRRNLCFKYCECGSVPREGLLVDLLNDGVS
jgi:hypothetical protein